METIERNETWDIGRSVGGEAASGIFLRREKTRDPFPPCKELLRWPGNYPVNELADLDEEEMNQTNPRKFRYSHAEMSEWSRIVNAVLDEALAPKELHGRTAVCTSPLQARDRIRIKDPTQSCTCKSASGFFWPLQVNEETIFIDFGEHPRLERKRAGRKERRSLFF